MRTPITFFIACLFVLFAFSAVAQKALPNEFKFRAERAKTETRPWIEVNGKSNYFFVKGKEATISLSPIPKILDPNHWLISRDMTFVIEKKEDCGDDESDCIEYEFKGTKGAIIYRIYYSDEDESKVILEVSPPAPDVSFMMEGSFVEE
jgi:hypothetical protein